MGGTEILKPIKHILNQPTEYPRQLFLLTDGEVDNTESITDYIRTHCMDTRVFTFGIGQNCSRSLVRGMAKAGNGKAVFVVNSDEIQSQVVEQVERSLSPALINMNMDWGSFKVVQQAPHYIPSIYSGSRLLLYSQMDGRSDPSNVELRVVDNNETKSFALSIEQIKWKTGNMIHTLAGRQMIRDLEEGTLKDEVKDHKSRIESIGLRYNLASKYTSFVAVSDNVDDEPQKSLTKVPVGI